jgi:zinc transport system substrate-binding protein
LNAYPLGTDIHEYELTPKDLNRIAHSKALFYIGARLEPFIELGTDSTFKNQPVKLINITKTMELSLLTCEGLHCSNDILAQDDDQAHFFDPHIWLSPKRMIDMAGILKNELLKLRPADSTTDYDANYNLLITRLQVLDASLKSKIGEGTVDTIIVDHDAYQYWTKDYNLKRIRLRTNNDSTETNARELQTIVNEARNMGIKHVLITKNEAANPNVGIILDQIGGTSLTIHELANLTKEEYANNANYFQLMEKNIDAIGQALKLQS